MENKDKVNENKIGKFQSYRFTVDPIVVSIDKSQIPEHVQKRLEKISKMYEVKAPKDHKNE